MAAVPFDTLKLADRLQQGGFTPEQARAAATSLAEALGDGLGADIGSLKADATDLRADMRLLKWMVGFNLAATVGIIMLLLRH